MAKPITRTECTRRTVEMVAYFLKRPVSAIKTSHDLRRRWGMADDEFEILEGYIERPITTSRPGFFQDVGADVSVADLKKKAGTVAELADLIWDSL